MAQRDGASIRRERMQNMAKIVHRLLEKDSEKLYVSLTRTVAYLAYEFGLTHEKVREYLTTLEELEHFIIDHENDLIRKITRIDLQTS